MKNNWIGVYDDFFPSNACQYLISEFEASDVKSPGILRRDNTDDIVDKGAKDSMDLTVSFYNECPMVNLVGNYLADGIKKYRKDYPSVDAVEVWQLFPFFNIQRYYPGQGFHQAHCETSDGKTSRILAWMIYLNTLTDGGQTRFPDYDFNLEAVEGRLAIWPAYFTHMHHGITSKTQTKYIATGWYSFAQ
jgi:hypothetical protein